MEKQGEFASGRAYEPIPSEHRKGDGGSEPRRRSRSREELRSQLHLLRRQRRTLAILIALLLLACSGLVFWALGRQSALDHLFFAVERKQAQIESLTDQLAVATTGLEESRRAVDAMVADRIPGLLPFRVGEPLSVDTPFVRELSFKPAAPPASGHECKLVIENHSSSVIRPTLSIVLFDDVGVQLARAQLVDGGKDALRADEIRSFFVSLEVAEGRVPRYFRLTSD